MASMARFLGPNLSKVLPGGRPEPLWTTERSLPRTARLKLLKNPKRTVSSPAKVVSVLSERPDRVSKVPEASLISAERDFGSALGVLYDTPQRGSPELYGATAVIGGVNFAIPSSTATAVSLCLFTDEDLQQGLVSAEIPLHPLLNRTGHVWHIFLPAVSAGLAYGYRVDGKYSPEEGLLHDATKIVLDPYAKAVVSRTGYGVTGADGECWPQMAGVVPSEEDEDSFDWEGDVPPNHEQKDLVIYEIHVRGFTQHHSSGAQFPGTYLGLVEKLPYLKALGVNALELMPINEFNELEYYTYNPGSGDYRVNFWGYSTVNFYSPMAGYSTGGGRTAINEFKTLVKEAHKLGIEVILDVVFNHTAEGNEMGPTLSFRGLDNKVFYMTAPKGEYYNYSGCGNTVNCNHPVVRKFIVDCLKYWVIEMHVDGFRFDLASILTRASSLWDSHNVFGAAPNEEVPPEASSEPVYVIGTPIERPPLIDMISNDPILGGVKLIAEAWDAGGLYQVGNFPHWGKWAEWNGKFRDTVRQFIKGTDGIVGDFAKVLCGSPHLYQQGGRKPYHSVNFITAHDGFTLNDLVSYNEKHNEANGENNNDGENHNLSWNCGQEGEQVMRPVQTLRQRQMRNMFLALFVAQGVPMFYMGDEYGHTKKGNNNTYCHDSEVNYFQWDKLESEGKDLFRFCSLLSQLRKETTAFRLPEFPTGQNLSWHGVLPDLPDWSETSRFIAFSIRDEEKGEIYVAFNASHLPVFVTLPERPGSKWKPLIDTSNVAPFDFFAGDVPDLESVMASMEGRIASNMYPMLNYSSVVLKLEVDVI